MRLPILLAALALAACNMVPDTPQNRAEVPAAGTAETATPPAAESEAPFAPETAGPAPAPVAGPAPAPVTAAAPPAGYEGPDFAPGFACKGDLSRTEKMICADRGLAELDRRLSRAFAATRSGTDPATRAELLEGQRAFLARRDACTTAECLERGYRDRLADVARIADTAPASCAAEIGEAAAARLVRQCISVSPATHPPCNAANSCAMVRGEIERSCAMFAPDDADRPRFCDAR